MAQHFRIQEPYSVTAKAPTDPRVAEFVVLDNDHTPYNKRHREVDAAAKLELMDNAKAGFIGITLQETVTHGTRSQTRTISMYIRDDVRAALLAFLSRDLGE